MGNFITQADVLKELMEASINAVASVEVNVLIDSVESLWDEMTNKKYYQQEHTQYFSFPSDEVSFDQELNAYRLFLRNYPLVSITDIWDDPNRAYSSDYRIAATNYTMAEDIGIVLLERVPKSGRNNIKVTYNAGYNATTFPKSIKQILTRQIAHWFRQAKDKKSDMSSISQPDGGSIAFSQLEGNLLPDFVTATNRHSKKSLL